MRLRFFFPRISIGCILGLCLALVLHACQTPQTPQSQPTAPPQALQSSEQPLPPETAEEVKSAGPEGLLNPQRGDVRLVVISDLNSVYGSTDYDPEVDKGIALIPFWKPDMVVCSGDMVAGQSPTLSEPQIKAMWAAFDEHVAAPLRRAKLPYGFTIGNHDASSAVGIKGNFLFQKERDLASAYWNDPEHDPGVKFIDKFEFPFYYTFEYKDIFFMAWDGSSSRIPKDKLQWVEKTLASPKAQAAKMRILLSHLPLYAVAVGRNQPGDVIDNADEMREMLERYQVHTYISGHHHSYYPGHRGKLQLLHMGIVGSGPRPLIDAKTPPWKALTVVDINFKSPELTTYTTYDIRTLKVIKNEQLPRFLAGHNGIVLRRDVEFNELTTQEKSFCEQRLGKKLCGA
ncbi:MAG: metallophosphoesterase [Cyanomargarita calcarea GSE-NOS-MK-12-04C]|jgi:3',5'-cyclic AMP phosphodiesterase CpdA|uniref:Metallophosphoesterase n=1 Tax=Cyanomargarita calcarea GSE-NOS-MK-12-04C TaxID=2839659 RepID=A0A951QK48_9CYAN|nr:metallophosphoesterase [Cyanomargarita calcarea GSE-NOS-MK-12-04C]